MVSVASFVGVSVIICNRWYHCSNIRIFLVELRIYLFLKGSPGSTHGNSYGLNNTGKDSYLIFCSTACATNPFQPCISLVSIFSILLKSNPLSISTFNYNNFFQYIYNTFTINPIHFQLFSSQEGFLKSYSNDISRYFKCKTILICIQFHSIPVSKHRKNF